jgi:phosphate transport system substrate-binding protein
MTNLRRFLLFAGAALLLAACGRSGGQAVDVLGSTSIQPFAEVLAEEFNPKHPGIVVEVQGGGSTAGLQAVANSIAEIGMCSRSLSAEEKGFDTVLIARDGLAVVVHPSNPVAGLTRDQVRRLFSGEVTNWRQVGGDERVVRLITREEGSGTREAFAKLVMGKERISRKALTQESNGAVKELVKHDPAGIGYMSLGLVGGEAKILTIDGAPATVENVSTGKYPLVRPFLFATKGPVGEKARSFIDFVLSDEGQDALRREGLVGVK